jgi:hypothetical protein
MQQPSRPTSGLAVASLVLGIVGLLSFVYGVGSLLAVIFGAIGMKQTQDGQRGGRGMAIAGLVMGIIGLVAGVAFFLLVAGTFGY